MFPPGNCSRDDDFSARCSHTVPAVQSEGGKPASLPGYYGPARFQAAAGRANFQFPSGRPDLNRGPPAPEAGALTGLRYAPFLPKVIAGRPTAAPTGAQN